MRVLLLFNPIAGSGRAGETARQLHQALIGAGHEVREAATGPIGADDASDRERLAGIDVVLVCGGDGAVRLAAGACIAAEVPLYHVPCGTENLFARESGSSRRTEDVLAALAAGRVERVDVAFAEDRLFLLMASVGLDAEVVHDLACRRAGGISHLSYVAPILRQIRRWRPPRLTVRVDGRAVVRGRAGMVVVGNARQYGGRLNPAARASMTDGRLDAVFFPFQTRWGLVRWALASRLGRHTRDARLVYEQGREVEIESDVPVRFQLDGDPPHAGSSAADDTGGGRVTRLHLTVRPAALPVLQPA